MADPVEIVFRVSGIADVQQAFRSIDDIMSKFDGKRKASGDRAVREAKGQAAKQVDAHVREWDRWKKSVDRIRSNSATMAGRLAGKQAGDEARAAAKRIAEEQRAARAIETIRTRSATMAGRIAKQQADKEISEAKRAAGARRQFDTSIGRTVGGTVGRLGRGAVNLGSAALALGGGMSVMDVVGRANSAESEAIAVANDAYQEGAAGAAGRRRDPKALQALAGRVQGETNIDKVKLLEGLHKYVEKSSDLEGGEKNLGEFARMAKASGTDLSEIMETAGKLRASNRHMAPEDMMSVMRGITGQGKEGTLTMRDLAAQGGKITSSAGQFTGSQTVNQRRLLGLAQVAGRENDAAESATAVTAFASDVSVHAKAIEDKGAKVLGADGKLLPGSDIIANIMKITGGNTAKLKALGIQREAVKVFHAAQGTFDDAGGGAAGAEAVRKDIKSLEDKGYSEKALNEDFAVRMAANGEKMNGAMLKLREAVEREVAPKLLDFANKLPELIPKIERLIRALGAAADWLLDNPYKGVAAIISAAVARDLANAAIGKGVEMAIVAMLARIRGAGAVVDAAAAGGGAAASSGTAAAAATLASRVAAPVAAFGVVVHAANETLSETDQFVANEGLATTLAGKGATTPDQLKEQKKRLEYHLKTQKQSMLLSDILGGGLEGVASVFGAVAPSGLGLGNIGGEAKAAGAEKRVIQEKSIAETEAAITRLVAALGIAEAALGGTKPSNPDNANRHATVIQRNGGAGNDK